MSMKPGPHVPTANANPTLDAAVVVTDLFSGDLFFSPSPPIAAVSKSVGTWTAVPRDEWPA